MRYCTYETSSVRSTARVQRGEGEKMVAYNKLEKLLDVTEQRQVLLHRYTTSKTKNDTVTAECENQSTAEQDRLFIGLQRDVVEDVVKQVLQSSQEFFKSPFESSQIDDEHHEGDDNHLGQVDTKLPETGGEPLLSVNGKDSISMLKTMSTIRGMKGEGDKGRTVYGQRGDIQCVKSKASSRKQHLADEFLRFEMNTSRSNGITSNEKINTYGEHKSDAAAQYLQTFLKDFYNIDVVSNPNKAQSQPSSMIIESASHKRDKSDDVEGTYQNNASTAQSNNRTEEEDAFGHESFHKQLQSKKPLYAAFEETVRSFEQLQLYLNTQNNSSNSSGTGRRQGTYVIELPRSYLPRPAMDTAPSDTMRNNSAWEREWEERKKALSTRSKPTKTEPVALKRNVNATALDIEAEGKPSIQTNTNREIMDINANKGSNDGNHMRTRNKNKTTSNDTIDPANSGNISFDTTSRTEALKASVSELDNDGKIRMENAGILKGAEEDTEAIDNNANSSDNNIIDKDRTENGSNTYDNAALDRIRSIFSRGYSDIASMRWSADLAGLSAKHQDEAMDEYDKTIQKVVEQIGEFNYQSIRREISEMEEQMRVIDDLFPLGASQQKGGSKNMTQVHGKTTSELSVMKRNGKIETDSRNIHQPSPTLGNRIDITNSSNNKQRREASMDAWIKKRGLSTKGGIQNTNKGRAVHKETGAQHLSKKLSTIESQQQRINVSSQYKKKVDKSPLLSRASDIEFDDDQATVISDMSYDSASTSSVKSIISFREIASVFNNVIAIHEQRKRQVNGTQRETNDMILKSTGEGLQFDEQQRGENTRADDEDNDNHDDNDEISHDLDIDKTNERSAHKRASKTEDDEQKQQSDSMTHNSDNSSSRSDNDNKESLSHDFEDVLTEIENETIAYMILKMKEQTYEYKDFNNVANSSTEYVSESTESVDLNGKDDVEALREVDQSDDVAINGNEDEDMLDLTSQLADAVYSTIFMRQAQKQRLDEEML